MQHPWSLKLDHNLCFHATNHSSKFRGQAMWLRCVQYVWGWDFNMYGKLSVHISKLSGPRSTCNIPEALNLTTTFVSMLPITLVSFVVRRCGCGVFSVCEDNMYGKLSVHISKLSGPRFHMQHPWSLKLDHNLCFHGTNHNSKFRGQATQLRCVQYIWEWELYHVRQSKCTHIS